MFAKPQTIHFIGIGGIGMSGIAEILLNLGYTVSGSDLRRSPITDRLAGLGATVFEGHTADNVTRADVAVTSSAVLQSNPEVVEARLRKIPVIQRAEMLAELMRLKYGVAIAGMHGKTTTTSMIAVVLAAAGLDPTVVVGGRVGALGSNARAGQSRYLVAEADESDRSFLKLSPILAVVTNLDREHMDCYRDMDDVRSAFLEFIDRVPFYGACVACADDPELAKVLARATRKIYTYGVSEAADFRIVLLPHRPGCRSHFEVSFGKRIVLGNFALKIPGHHNILNATAAIAIATLLDIPAAILQSALESFGGVDRRFEIKGVVRGVTVVDDYGHHPTEIRATLQAARDCGFRNIHVIFQPHRYTRTRDLLPEFASAFHDADQVHVLDIYAASEEPIAGIDSPTLVAAMQKAQLNGRPVLGKPTIRYCESFDEAVRAATAEARDGDVILTLGAGNVSSLAPRILENLAETSAT